MQIANAPCSWGLPDRDTPGEMIGYRQMLDELAATGYTGTELGDYGYMPSDPAALRAEMESRNLTMLGSFVGVALDDPDAHTEGEERALRVARLLHPELSLAAWQWIAQQLEPRWQTLLSPGEGSQALLEAAEAVRASASGELDPLASFYEHFLHAHHPTGRMQRGVFYTPLPMVRYIVRAVDRSLREEFAIPNGLLGEQLGDGTPLRILDPALGAGLFLTEILLHARSQVTDDAAWNQLVPSLISRLGGMEILPAAAAVAVVRIGATLQRTGYRFEDDARIDLRIADALAAPLRPAWPVIVGNPPFSGISEAKHPWLHDLLHGRGPEGAPRASYFDVAGQPLGERKHWLQDDYVKFLRIAHEQIETTGQGIVALVTSHGYLDNITFRGLREKLTQTFPRITLVDLHGNAKRRERTASGERDENVFGIEQGVAIGILRRSATELSPLVERCDLWGSREEKFTALQADKLPWQVVNLIGRAPGQAFHVHEAPSSPEYDAGWALDEAMPISTTAPVTARDHFLVAFSEAELAARCRDFCDPELADEAIRERYFQRTRSRRYLPGDTRGWKLTAARQRMQAGDWRTLVRRVLYRPFDERVMLWADWLVDWPRSEVIQHLLGGDNLTLITRRQAPPGQPWTFAWITDCLTLDGVIRSDNRGSESLFPLWISSGTQRIANFSSAFLAALRSELQAKDEPCGEQVLAYIYALLHAPQYRERYAAALASDFPRIILPRSQAWFERLAKIGTRLMDAHLQRGRLRRVPYKGESTKALAPGFPKYDRRKLWINERDYFGDVMPRMWPWMVGSHRVCQKLLKDRRGRTLEAAEIEQLSRALGGVRRAVTTEKMLQRVWAAAEHQGLLN